MLDQIVDHWSCDWCGAKETATRDNSIPGARSEAAWPKGWHGFCRGEVPWKLKDTNKGFKEMAAMCAECLSLPILHHDSLFGRDYMLVFEWGVGSGSYVSGDF